MKEVGTKKEVYNDKARRTKKGLTKNDLEVNAKGNVVQKKRGRASAPSARPAPSAPSASSTRAMNNFGKWHDHVKKFRASHPNLSYKEALQQAKTTYKKGGTTQPPRQEPREEKQREQKTRDEPVEEKKGAKPDAPPLPKSKKPKGHFVDGKFYPYPTEKAPPRPSKKEKVSYKYRKIVKPQIAEVQDLKPASKKPRLPMRPLPPRPKVSEKMIPDKPRVSSFETSLSRLRDRNETFEKGQVYDRFDMLIKIGDRTKTGIRIEMKHPDGTIKKATPKVRTRERGGEWLNLTEKMTGGYYDVTLEASDYETSPATEKQKELLLTKGTPLPTDIIKYISGMADTDDLTFVKGKYYRYRLIDHPDPLANDILFRYEGDGNFRDYVSGNVYTARMRNKNQGSRFPHALFAIDLYDTGYTYENRLRDSNVLILINANDDDVVTRFDMRRKEEIEERLRNRRDEPREEKQREQKTREEVQRTTQFIVGGIYYKEPDILQLRQRLSAIAQGADNMDEGQRVVESQELRDHIKEVLSENENVGYKVLKVVVGGGNINRMEDKVYQLQPVDIKSKKNIGKPFYASYNIDKEDGAEIIDINVYVILNSATDSVEQPLSARKEEEKKEEPRGKGLKRKRTYGGGLSRDEHHRNIISAGIVRY